LTDYSPLTLSDIEKTYREIMAKDPARIIASGRRAGKTAMQQQLMQQALEASEQDDIITEILRAGSERNLLDYLLESDPDFEPHKSEKEALRPHLQDAMELLRAHELFAESFYKPSRLDIRIEPEPVPGMWQVKNVPMVFLDRPIFTIGNVC
jgi:hypothetical protein